VIVRKLVLAMSKTFAELGLSDETLRALAEVGYQSPSPIQEEAIPPLLSGRDVIGQAQTGTGKTAAFGLPILEYLDTKLGEVQALVLTPTRELCIQVTQAIRAYGSTRQANVVAVFGGAPIRNQEGQLRAGGQVVVGTVGRVLDLATRGSLVLHDCRFVVLDEADEMLDLGFLEDVERILARTPNGRQTALFSATIPKEIQSLADRYLYDPIVVRVQAPTLTIETVEQFQLTVASSQKEAKLVEVLRAERPEQAIVFVRTKIRCERLFRTLRDQGMDVRALHGDMTQGARDGVMLAFKAARLPLLVATDVAARGLDISTVTHVINFDVPVTPDIYVHRVGRTGRLGRSGRAITFVEPRQRHELEAIERHIGMKIAPWSSGAHAAAPALQPRPRRHEKPHVQRAIDEPKERLIVSGGRRHGIDVAGLVAAITGATGLDGEAISDVMMLERFTLLSVPATEVRRVIDALEDTRVDGRRIRAERAELRETSEV
jgi:ATP-dependent RNA helicase DeaD